MNDQCVIASWLPRRAALNPDKEALVDGDRRLTYGQLDRRVNGVAHALRELGLRPGDRLAILSPNRVEYVELLLAAAKLSLVVVPLNVRLTARELAFMLDDSGTQVLFFDPSLGKLAQGCQRELSRELRWVAFGKRSSASAIAYESALPKPLPRKGPHAPPPREDTPHIIMYTSGTTGKPKGAVLGQGASFWNALNLSLALDFSSHDRNLLALPLFHIGGIGLFTLPMLYAGGTCVLMGAFDEAQALELFEKERITLFFGVPAMFLRFAEARSFGAEAFKSLRVIMSGGAPLPRALVRRYAQAGIVLQQGFGMSEAGPSIATLARDRAVEKAGSVGAPVFHLDARIVDDAFEDVPVGEVGELVLRGPNLLLEYWNRPEATSEAFVSGYFRTGDLARFDDDGDMWIVDRSKDMFISGGENVYPAEVEGALFEMEQVAEVAVIGVPDDRWGEVGRAFVVVKPGHELSPRQVRDHALGRLAKYKVPRQVVFTEALPRNAAGKVQKPLLRQMARNG